MADGNIFISYRRGDDSASAGRLCDRLESHFGAEHVFFDTHAIPFGVDFAEVLKQRLLQCDVQLVVIGEGWIEAMPELQDENDFVRIEIETALGRADIPVIPVLIEGVGMPARERLPESLWPLTRRNAFTLSHAQFASSVDGPLVEALRPLLSTVSARDSAPDAPAPHNAEDAPTAPEAFDEDPPYAAGEAFADISENIEALRREKTPPPPEEEEGDGSILLGCAFWIVLAALVGGVLWWLFSGDGDTGEVSYYFVGDGMCRTGQQGANVMAARSTDLNSCNEICFGRGDCYGFSHFGSSGVCWIHTAPITGVAGEANAVCWAEEN